MRENTKERFYTAKREMEQMPISLGFENVALRQSKNLVKSRMDISTRSEVIKGVVLNIPLIAANMSTVCNADFCTLLANLGAMGVLHRAATTEWLISETTRMAAQQEHVAVSVGVGGDQLTLAKKLIKVGANIVFIDIAHGYSDSMSDMAKALKDLGVKVVAGNTVNPYLLDEIQPWIDAIKVGIAQGYACETKNTAGCTEKQFSAVYNFRYAAHDMDIPVISDGGVREPADFVKAIGAGASSVMAGMIFARCPESAAELTPFGQKIYAGMASRYVQDQWKGGVKPGTCTEGTVKYLDIGESAGALLDRYSGALRSGMTYAGSTTVSGFQLEATFVRLAS